MNYKNFKRCVNSQKYPRFCLPHTALTCTSYEEFKFEVTKWRKYLVSSTQREENEFISELDYAMGVVERLEKV